MTTATPSYKGHRYPVEIINHCVWLYFRFPFSFREVEELMLVRGVAVSLRDDPAAGAPSSGRSTPISCAGGARAPGDKWHLDEVFVKINGSTRLPVARGRPARQRARRSGPVTPKRGGRHSEFFRKLLKDLR